MSFHDWLHKPSTRRLTYWGIGVILAFVAGFAIGSSIYSEYDDQGAAERKHVQTIAHDKELKQDAESIRLRPPKRDENPTRQQWREEQALKAQNEQARWAFWTMAAAIVGLGVSGVGIFYIQQTLVATRGAVSQAAAGVQVAREANQTMREAGESQALQTQESLEISRLAADAAMLNARAAIGIELPILSIEPLKFSQGNSRIGGEDERHYFFVSEIAVANTGRTRAVPVRIDCGWEFGSDLPPTPTYVWSTLFKIESVIEPAPAKPAEFWLHELRMDVPANAYERLKNRTAKFWFFVRLTYLDFMGVSHEVGLCWQRTEGFGLGHFTVEDAPAYSRKT